MKKVQFKYNSPDANNVHLVGEFNEWNINTNPMQKDAKGSFSTEIELDAGKYMYKFLEDNIWKNDPQADNFDYDAVGTQNSVKQVR